MPTTAPNGDHQTANRQHGVRRDQGRHNPPVISGESCFASPPCEESQEDGNSFEDAAGNGHFDHQIPSWISVEHLGNDCGVWMKGGERGGRRGQHVASGNERTEMGEVGILLKIPPALSPGSQFRREILDLKGMIRVPGLALEPQ